MGKRWTVEEKRRLITNVIRGGYTDRIRWQAGPEIEHFVMERESMKRVMYPGEKGVEGILETFLRRHADWTPTYDEGHLIGLEKLGNSITLEPGAQLETSLAPSESLRILLHRYQEMLDALYEILDPMGYVLVTVGVDPFTPIDAIPLLPKHRYESMDAHMSQKGNLARAMMRQSAAFQVSVDVGSDADFVSKYRVLAALSPIFYTLFDSAPQREGKALEKFNARQEIWRHTDPARTGIPPTVFDPDFSVESYADWVLSAPPIFVPCGDAIKATGDRTLSDILDETETEEEAQCLVKHGMSIVFPDIRAKQILEIRMMDSVPASWAFGAAAMLKGLLYNMNNMRRLQDMFTPMQVDWVERGKNSGRDNGIQGYYHSDYFVNWGLGLLAMAREGLSVQEGKLLDPLEILWKNLDTPRSVLARNVAKEGWTKALRKWEARHVLS
ncbi:glutamate--cysteine ligase [Levyella massiliensis]|uniref:glutamate--cysteine ligase n=1 Tax=Levyella massiliensis TaxID=938289 RepID=UPI003EB7CB74